MTCKFEISQLDNGGYYLAGELVFDTVSAILARSAIIFQADADIDIDLSGVVRADSAGLALLVEWMRGAKKRQHKVVFRNMPEQMSVIAGLVGLDEILPLE